MRFIDVDDFKKEIMKCNADPINEFDLGWDTWGIFNAIDRTPTADVTPVIHAHWIKHGEPPWYVIECSECGAKWQMSGSWDANNFCGNCGAKMDEEVQ